MFRCAELILPAALLHVALAGCPAETGACHGHGFSSSSGARKARKDCIGRWSGMARPDMCQMKTGNAVAESENIVAETAEKIFSDLADAQTINRDRKGTGKQPP